MHDADRQVLFQLDDCRETAVPVNDSQLILPRERGRKVDVVGGVGEEGHGASDGNSPGAADFAARRDRGICRVESCRALPHEIFLSTAYVDALRQSRHIPAIQPHSLKGVYILSETTILSCTLYSELGSQGFGVLIDKLTVSGEFSQVYREVLRPYGVLEHEHPLDVSEIPHLDGHV